MPIEIRELQVRAALQPPEELDELASRLRRLGAHLRASAFGGVDAVAATVLGLLRGRAGLEIALLRQPDPSRSSPPALVFAPAVGRAAHEDIWVDGRIITADSSVASSATRIVAGQGLRAPSSRSVTVFGMRLARLHAAGTEWVIAEPAGGAATCRHALDELGIAGHGSLPGSFVLLLPAIQSLR